MDPKPAPPRARRWIDARPQLHAAWLELRHTATRPLRQWLLGIALVAGASAVLVMGWPKLLRLLGPEVVTLGVLVAVPTSLWVQRARAAWTARYAGDWLSALPATRGAVRAAIALRALSVPGAALALLLLLAPLLAAAAPESAHDTGQLLLGICTALAGGACLGWWLPRRAEPPVAASTERGFARPVSRAALGALSAWPILQTRAWLPPRSIGRLVVPILLLLPMGTSGNLAIAIGAAWSLALWLGVLLRATVLVAQQSARWLRPTPVGVARFAWAVAWQATLKQVQWTLLAAGLCVALGVQTGLALRAAETWLAVVTVTTSTALAQAYRNRGLRIRLVASLCVVAALERLRAWLALPAAVLFAAWELRSAVRPVVHRPGGARP